MLGGNGPQRIRETKGEGTKKYFDQAQVDRAVLPNIFQA